MEAQPPIRADDYTANENKLNAIERVYLTALAETYEEDPYITVISDALMRQNFSVQRVVQHNACPSNAIPQSTAAHRNTASPIEVSETRKLRTVEQRQRSIDLHNLRGRSARDHFFALYGGSGDGIDIEMNTSTGRTTIRTYLAGLSRHRYIVPIADWDFKATNAEFDHDERFHFVRLGEIHPYTAAVIAAYAQHGFNQLARGNTIKAENTATILDYFFTQNKLGQSFYDDQLCRMCDSVYDELRAVGSITDESCTDFNRRIADTQRQLEHFIRTK